MSDSINFNKYTDELETLNTMLETASKGLDYGISELEHREDEFAMEQRIRLLLKAHRFTEAASAVKAMPSSEQLLEVSLLALILNGEHEHATTLYLSRKDGISRSARLQCEAAMATALLKYVQLTSPKSRWLSPQNLDSAEKHILKKAGEYADKALGAIITHGITTLSESVAAEAAVSIYALTKQNEKVKSVVEALLEREPIPLAVGRAIRSRIFPPHQQLLRRIADEHPESFPAKYLLMSIYSEILDTPGEALQLAPEAVILASDNEERELAYAIIHDLARETGANAEDYLADLAVSLPQSCLFVQFVNAARELDSGRPEAAKIILDDCADQNNPMWLQNYATLEYRLGNRQSALLHLKAAATLTNNLQLLKDAAQVALELHELSLGAELLERYITQTADDIDTRSQLAYIYFKLQDFANVLKHLKFVSSIDPTSVSSQVNLAVAYLHAGQPENALDQFAKTLHANPDASADVFIRYARLLRMRNMSAKAFELVQGVRERFWENLEFVACYQEISFACGNDGPAHEALLKMQQLQELSSERRLIVRGASLEELKALMHRRREIRDEIYEMVCSGRLPWTAVAELTGESLMLTWAIHTSLLNWSVDTPRITAGQCIYATNGFGFRPHDEALVPLQCAPAATVVVADISALITLYKLSLLRFAADYFEKILIPSPYLLIKTLEFEKLLPHQQSQVNSARAIVDLVDKQRIRIVENNDDSFYIDEYSDLPQAVGLKSIFSVLESAGRISSESYKQLKTSLIKKEITPIPLGSKLRVQLSSLQLISNFSLLDEFVSSYSVSVSSADLQELRLKTLEVAEIERLYDDWNLLWSIVSEDSTFQPVSVPEDDEDHEKLTARVALSGIAAATTTQLPLLADDRVCQTAVINMHRDFAHAAFGTDVLLQGLLDSSIISLKTASEAYLQLIRWRYRFILIPVEVLKEFADDFKQALPGKSLEKIAKYIQDCIRDVGLFDGVERADPPSSMQTLFFVHYLQLAGKLISAVWGDELYTNVEAARVTHWVCREFIPAVSIRGDSYSIQTLEAHVQKAVVSHSLLQATISQCTRLYEMTVALKEGFKMDKVSFERVVLEVVRVTSKDI